MKSAGISDDRLLEYQQFARELAAVAGAVVLSYFRSNAEVQNKSIEAFDPVTVADREAERVMREMICARYPDHGIFGEERGHKAGSAGLTWVLDPIDGTRSFISGIPTWGTLIALNDGHRPALGIMNQPFTGEQFIGTKAGAWLNGSPMKTRKCSRLADAYLMASSPAMFEGRSSSVFNSIAAEARMVRYGGACYAYCMLAAGFVDVVIEAGLESYDIQALIPIIESAGGIVTTWEGKDCQDGGRILACGDPVLNAQLLLKLESLGASALDTR